MGSSKLGMARFWPSVKNEEPKAPQVVIPKIIHITDYEYYDSHEVILAVTFKDQTIHHCEPQQQHKCHELMAQWAKSIIGPSESEEMKLHDLLFCK
jgi:hypothetical protein